MKKIMKFVFIGLVCAVIIALAGAMVFMLTFDIKRYKPDIIAAAQKAAGRQVAFDDIVLKVSLARGIQLRLSGLSVAEDPSFGATPFFTAERIDLGISPVDLIMKKQVRVLNAAVKTPQVIIVRLFDGRFNVQSLAQKPAQEQKGQKKQSFPPASSVPAIPAVFINDLLLEKMSIRYIDRSESSAIDLTCRDIRFAVRNFSFGKEFNFDMRASLFSQEPDFSIRGKARYIPEKQTIEITNAAIGSDLSLVSAQELKNSVSALKEASLPEQLKGAVKINLESLTAGPAGLVSLKASGELTEGMVKFKELAVPLGSIRSKFNMTESLLTFNDTACSLGKGMIVLSGEIKDYLNTQQFQLKASAAGIDLAECLDQSSYSIKTQGLLSGSVEGNGKGFDPKSLPAALTAAGNLEMKEGRLVDFNVLKMVFEKIPVVSNLAGILETNLPEEYREKFRQKDTVITSLKLAGTMAGGSITIQPAAAEAEGFSFEGTGTAGLDKNFSLNGSFVILQDMSSRIIDSVPEMKFLQDESQQIRFPLQIAGKDGAVSFMPDVRGIGVNAIKNKAAEELQKVFDKVFK